MTNKEVKAAFLAGYFGHAQNLYTDGITLTSYRTIVAKHFTGLTLRTSTWYSKTTAKHLSGIPADMDVPAPEARTAEDHKRNIKYLQELERELDKKIRKARKQETRNKYISQWNKASHNIDIYQAYFEV